MNPKLSEFAVQTLWDASQSGVVQLSLFSPSGNDYDRSTHDPAVIHQLSVDTETLAILKPQPGQWTIRLLAGYIPLSGLPVRIVITQIPLSDFAPIAAVGVSTDRGVAPLPIQFNGDGSSPVGATITSYSWDFGDCSPVDGVQSPTHVFSTAGTFTVRLTVTDSNDQSDTATQGVFVTAYDHAPSASFLWGLLDASKPNQVLVNAQTSNDVDGQITIYAWDFGDGTSGSGELIEHAYSKAGTYAVKLTVTDNGGLTGSTCEMVTTGQSLGETIPCAG